MKDGGIGTTTGVGNRASVSDSPTSKEPQPNSPRAVQADWLQEPPFSSLGTLQIPGPVLHPHFSSSDTNQLKSIIQYR